MANSVTPEDWMKGIALSVMASIIGGASKLAIRKSWLLEFMASDPCEENKTEAEETKDIVIENDTPGESSALYSRMIADGTESTGSLSSSGFALTQEEPAKSLFVPYALRLSGMIGMTFLNPICSVLAMNYASPSILAPFSGLTLVWIVLFSNPVIGEIPSRAQVVAVALIVLGEVIVATFGDHQNDADVTLTKLRDSYLDPLFIFYFLVMFVLMLGLVYVMKFGASPYLRRFAWGVSGGTITGLQNFLKDSLTILKVANASHESHYPWYLYLMILLAMATSFVGLLLLTACMKRFDATYSSAMFVGSFVVSASLMSAVHYNTFENLKDYWDYVLYPAGLVVLMAGVFTLVLETNESSDVAEPEVSPDERVASVDDPATERQELNEPLVQIVTGPGQGGDLAW